MILAHLDLDAFFAAVEELESPELRARPLVVGGDPHGRGVVATANYAARRFGIHSAMSAAEALRRCPHAVFVRPRHSLYREYSRHVWSTVKGIVPTVEQTGLDEGYLDVGEVARDFLDARVVAEAVQTCERDLVERGPLHEELAGMARQVAEHLQRNGQVARTVTTKLRYADFSIRRRSTSLDVGIDDAAQIAELACRLLDRGLRDRPGALRLVGVGVSGLAGYRQLALDAV